MLFVDSIKPAKLEFSTPFNLSGVPGDPGEPGLRLSPRSVIVGN